VVIKQVMYWVINRITVYHYLSMRIFDLTIPLIKLNNSKIIRVLRFLISLLKSLLLFADLPVFLPLLPLFLLQLSLLELTKILSFRVFLQVVPLPIYIMISPILWLTFDYVEHQKINDDNWHLGKCCPQWALQDDCVCHERSSNAFRLDQKTNPLSFHL